MTKMSYRQDAGTDERFAAGAFDHSIGRTVPLNLAGVPSSSAKLLSAVVADDGSSVELTVEIPDSVLTQLD